MLRAATIGKALVALVMLTPAIACGPQKQADAPTVSSADDAGVTVSSVDAATATTKEPAAASEGWVRCYGDKNHYCDASAITDNVKAQLEAMPDHDALMLTVAAKDQRELESLGKLPWLRGLSMPNAEGINDLAPLKALTQLRSLSIARASVGTLLPLAELHSLETLQLSNLQQLLDRDLTSIAGLTTLVSLDVDSCPTINDYSALTKLRSLEHLLVTSTEATKLDGAKGLPKLREVVVSGKLKDLSFVPTLPVLDTLIVQFSDGVADWSPISKAATLTTLKIEGCASLKQLPALAGLKSLTDLSLKSDDKLQSFAPIGALTSLRTLDVSGTKLTTLAPFATLKKLESIDLDGTAVRDLSPLAGNKGLRKVFVPKEMPKEAREALKKQLPDVVVESRDSAPAMDTKAKP